jgi:DNA (cytosine-5)-methyltransferase 1
MIDLVPFDHTQYLTLSLFCGWGGGDKGLHDAGFFTPWAVDNNKNARDCFKLNFPHTRVENWDLSTMRIEHIMQQFRIHPGQLDMSLFACPCQGISSAGKCDPYNQLNIMFLRTLRHYIPALQSKTWVIENVSGLLEAPMAPFYNLVQAELDALGKDYDIIVVLLNSVGFGVPQNRERVIILGVHRSLGISASLPEPFTNGNEGLRICDVLPYLDGIHYGYGGKKFKHKSNVCNTITRTPNIWARENGEMRDFHPYELLKLCGYPADWKYTGSDNQMWNRIGNSIMPPFMQAIGEHIRVNILEKAGVPKQNIKTFLKQ